MTGLGVRRSRAAGRRGSGTVYRFVVLRIGRAVVVIGHGLIQPPDEVDHLPIPYS